MKWTSIIELWDIALDKTKAALSGGYKYKGGLKMARPKKEAPNHATGMYEVKVTIGKDFKGNPIRKSFYSSKSKAEARLKAEEYKVNQAVKEITGEDLNPQTKTFSFCADKWLETVKRSIKDSTYNSHEINCRIHLKPHFGNRKISSITFGNVQDFFNQFELKAPRETMAKRKQTLSKIFDYAVNNEWCKTNPCEKIKFPEPKKTEEKRIYTDEQATLVSEYAKSHSEGLAVSLLLDYGLRKGEMLGLRWEDFDFQNRIIKIRKSAADVKDKNTGKNIVKLNPPKNEPSRREIPISVETANRINVLPREITVGSSRRKGIKGVTVRPEMIFCNATGGIMSPKNWTNRNYKRFMEDMQNHFLSQEKPLDIPILKPHELRHTRATIWVNSGMNIFAVAKILGHKDLKMLQERYAHSDVESTRNLLGIK